MACKGETDQAIAKILHISVATVERTRKQFVQENLGSLTHDCSKGDNEQFY